MDFEYYIYQYLQKHNRVEVPGFGVFGLISQSAKIDAENSVITPPKEIITFDYHPAAYSNDFAKFVAESLEANLFLVQSDLKNQVENWKLALQNEKHLDLRNIGQLMLDEQSNTIRLKDGAQAFGFEEINLDELKTKKKIKKLNGDFGFSKGVLWTFLSLIVVGGIVFYFFGDREILFGKPSPFLDQSVKKTTRNPKSVKIQKKQDSLKTDSIKPVSNAKIKETGR